MRRVMGSYPYPSAQVTPQDADDRKLEYDMARDLWARRLTEGTLRELAFEYRRGIRTEETEDAYAEYKRREANGLLANQRNPESNPKSQKSRKGNRSRK